MKSIKIRLTKMNTFVDNRMLSKLYMVYLDGVDVELEVVALKILRHLVMLMCNKVQNMDKNRSM